MIRLYDLSKDYLTYLELTEKADSGNNKDIWEQSCYLKHTDVYDHVFELYQEIGTSTELHESALKKFTRDELKSKIMDISNRFESELSQIIEIYKDLGICATDNEDVNVFLIVGNTSTNAVVTTFKNTSLFLFVESLPKGEYLKILLAHEMLHIFHQNTLSSRVEVPFLKDMIFFEGLACQASEIIIPRLSPSEYISFKKSDDRELRDSYIRNNMETIKHDLETDDWSIIRNYVSNGDFAVHRIGYDIGYYVVKEMLKSMDIARLMNSEVSDVRREFDKELKALYC